MAAPSSICVYPLSPSYLILHRYLYYLSLTLSVLYPTPPPLVKGAFAFSLTYSSTAALYAILILALPTPSLTDPSNGSTTTPQQSQQQQPLQILNLDILALWAILSPAAILLLPLLTWSRSLTHRARPIIRIWGVLVLTGTACTFVLLRRLSSSSSSSFVAATGDDGGDDGGAAALRDCQALAAAVDAAQKLRLRDPLHVLSVAYAAVFNPLFGTVAVRLVPLTFVPLAFGALSCLVSGSRSASAAGGAAVGGKALDASLESGGRSGGLEEVTWTDSMSTSPFVTVYKVFLLLRRIVLYLTSGWLLPVLVVNELYLLRDWPLGVPEAESMYEVGQWGLFAGLGLVSAAAAISSYTGSERDDPNRVVVQGVGNGDARVA